MALCDVALQFAQQVPVRQCFDAFGHRSALHPREDIEFSLLADALGRGSRNGGTSASGLG